jgi:hypothetical protein
MIPRLWDGNEARRVAASLDVYHWTQFGWAAAEAERAFEKAVRARRRRLARGRRASVDSARLVVFDGRSLCRPPGSGGVREIPLAAIRGSLDPGRAAEFDREFRPAPRTRRRWLAVWLAEHRGAGLPPITVTPVADGYAIVDGHHRVSVARARGALTIPAVVS